MAFSLDISKAAEEDIQEAAAFIALDSPSAATRWHKELWELIFSLREMPARFPTIPEANKLKMPYRSAIHYSHRVVYRIDEAKNTVFVVRVYHGARHALRLKDLI
jgi:plasmid stabilization system protein ParE